MGAHALPVTGREGLGEGNTMKNSMSRRQFILAAGALAGSAALAGCGESSTSSSSSQGTSSSASSSSSDDSYALVKDGTLTVVAELGFAPFEYMDDKTGDPEGFDVDVINAVAERMGLACEYLPNQKFDTLVPLIKQGGKADVAVAAITITDERLQSVDFSEPYLDSNQAIVALKGSTETEETLNDASKQVVCQGGTTGNDWIQENLPNATRVPVDDVTAALTGVQTGLYSAMVVDLPVAKYMLTNSFSDLDIIEEIATGEQYGIAVSKDNPNLRKAINKALEEMKGDGTMDSIETKWFGSTI